MMTTSASRTSARVALRATLSACLCVSAGCSAVISPDVDRLGGADAGVGADGAENDAGSVEVDTGTPSCGALLVDCSGACVDLASDPFHCGACDAACGGGAACAGGRCSGCVPGEAGCPGLGDSSRCGASMATCDRDQLCISGECACRPSLTLVLGACVDLASDPDNCGAPGTACEDVCARGGCAVDCPSGLPDCGGACVDVRSDPANCGDCGQTCAAHEACEDGGCRDVTVATGCTTCPCDACDGFRCCVLPDLGFPYCIDADGCP